MAKTYDQVSVTIETKQSFRSFKRKLEAEHDRDYTEDDVMRLMIGALTPEDIGAEVSQA